MHIVGTKLPLLVHEDGNEIDVWRMADGVAITLCRTDGRIYAGTQITKSEWDSVVKYIEEAFK